MTNKKSTKRALISSLLVMAMCFSMLVGSTFAWFTDSVTSSGNKIISGSLDVDLYQWTDANTSAEITANSSPIFGSSTSTIAQNINSDTLWEPGKTQIAYLSIKNNGNLWLKYTVQLVVKNVANNLYKVMKYEIVPDAHFGALADKSWATLGGLDAASIADAAIPANATMTFATTSANVPMAPEAEHFFALAIHMDEEAGNEYQNGEVDFDLKILATQFTKEEDSFNDQYDANADETPDNAGWFDEVSSVSGTVVADQPTVLTAAAAPTTADSNTTVTFAQNALTAGNTVKLDVKTADTETASAKDYSILGDDTAVGSIDLSLYVNNVEKTGDFGSAIIETRVAKNLSTVKVQYNGASTATFGEAVTATVVDSDTPASVVGTANYNPATGYLSFVTDHFSEYVLICADEAYLKSADRAYAKLADALDAAEVGDTVILLNDVSATAVLEVVKNLSINGAGHTINTTATRGIWIAADDVTLAVKDLTIDGKNKCERGLQVNTGLENDFYNAVITVDNCVIKNIVYYAINFCKHTTVDITINDSYISGWAAINAYGYGNTITVNDSELIGVNNQSFSNWNNFCTICMEGDTTGQTDEHSSAYMVSINNSKISATQTTGNIQCLLGFNNGADNSSVSFTNCTFEVGDGCYFGYDKGVNNTLAINGETVEMPVGFFFNIN